MDTKDDRLIVSPSNVKFQAPFPHNQKRQLSLLNLSGMTVVYKVELDEESLFTVCPESGCVDAFDTAELTIVMKPTDSEKDDISLSVHYLSKKEDCKEIADMDWQQALTSPLHITLENYMESEKELMRIFGGKDSKTMIKAIEKRYKPMCNTCCRKRMQKNIKRSSWLRRMSWSFLVLLLSVTGDYASKLYIYEYIMPIYIRHSLCWIELLLRTEGD